MKIISTNIGEQKEVMWRGQSVLTGIYKVPVDSIAVKKFNVEGDNVSDLTVHGGENKAVYGYPIEHYPHWEKEFPKMEMPWGMFGENLTTSGLLDSEARIGSIYQIGTTKLKVIQPRFPCIKINIRFALPDMIERFMEQKRNGIYFKVIEEGHVQVEDEIILTELSPYPVTVQDYVESYYSKGSDREILDTILSIPYLPQRQRSAFETFL